MVVPGGTLAATTVEVRLELQMCGFIRQASRGQFFTLANLRTSSRWRTRRAFFPVEQFSQDNALPPFIFLARAIVLLVSCPFLPLSPLRRKYRNSKYWLSLNTERMHSKRRLHPLGFVDLQRIATRRGCRLSIARRSQTASLTHGSNSGH